MQRAEAAIAVKAAGKGTDEMVCRDTLMGKFGQSVTTIAPCTGALVGTRWIANLALLIGLGGLVIALFAHLERVERLESEVRRARRESTED
jgi:hypothetical protein